MEFNYRKDEQYSTKIVTYGSLFTPMYTKRKLKFSFWRKKKYEYSDDWWAIPCLDIDCFLIDGKQLNYDSFLLAKLKCDYFLDKEIKKTYFDFKYSMENRFNINGYHHWNDKDFKIYELMWDYGTYRNYLDFLKLKHKVPENDTLQYRILKCTRKDGKYIYVPQTNSIRIEMMDIKVVKVAGFKFPNYIEINRMYNEKINSNWGSNCIKTEEGEIWGCFLHVVNSPFNIKIHDLKDIFTLNKVVSFSTLLEAEKFINSHKVYLNNEKMEKDKITKKIESEKVANTKIIIF